MVEYQVYANSRDLKLVLKFIESPNYSLLIFVDDYMIFCKQTDMYRDRSRLFQKLLLYFWSIALHKFMV